MVKTTPKYAFALNATEPATLIGFRLRRPEFRNTESRGCDRCGGTEPSAVGCTTSFCPQAGELRLNDDG